MAIKITDTFRLTGVPTDPTTVTYTIVDPEGTATTYIWPGAAEITHAGVGEFFLSLDPPALPGLYSYDVDGTGTVTASRKGSFNVLPNAVTQDLSWAVPGPCTAWVASQDIWNCCGQPMTTVDGEECPVDFTAEAQAASQVLFELSGRLFSGTCEKTVRPCSPSWCGFQVLSRGHIVNQGFSWSGSGWWWDSLQGCGCSPLDRIKLSGYPVREITEVKIDGVVVDPATYRLDDWRWLTRVRDPAEPDVALFWPSCQQMDLPDTEAGTFSVTYRYGEDPPLIGVHAAAELGCELYKACNNAMDCALPSGTTRVIRQGVVVERLAFSVWGLRNGVWSTGLTRVDTFLGAYNPNHLTRRPLVWAPGQPRYARTVGQ